MRGEEKLIKNEGMKKKTINQSKRIIGIVLLLIFIVFAIAVIITIVLEDKNVKTDDSNVEEEQIISDSRVSGDISIGSTSDASMIDYEKYKEADTYFSTYSKVLSVTGVEESNTIYSESEAQILFEEKGFNEFEGFTRYSIDGEYLETPIAISENSQDKHPLYESYYYNSNDELWIIYIIDNLVMASPVSYNIEKDLEVQVVFSEQDYVISYDGSTNKYYKNIPQESELIVFRVDKIDADLLNSLTMEKIDEYMDN